MDDHTEENRTVVRSGKSEAEVTNNRRLRSTYCGRTREECCLFDVRQGGGEFIISFFPVFRLSLHAVGCMAS